jgi:hypothetical protein
VSPLALQPVQRDREKFFFERPATKTTNRKPNLSSYASFSSSSNCSVAPSAASPCSRRECIDSDAGSAPIRGCALSAATRSDSVMRSSASRAFAMIARGVSSSAFRKAAASPGARSNTAASLPVSASDGI